jgi:hypothetical protein
MTAIVGPAKYLLTVSLIAFTAGCSMIGASKTVGPGLTGDQIKKTISGNTVQGPLGPAVYDWYYTSDGKVRGDVGLEDKDSGTWLIKGANTYCHQWTKFFSGVQRCYEWFKLEQSGQYLMKNVDADRHEDIEVFEIIEGNPYNM